MAEAKSKSEKDLSSLKSTVETVLSLTSSLLSAIKADALSQGSSTAQNEVNPLNLAHDAATLIKAHATKLSLLIINTPFTPTAITTVLREVSSGPLPALTTAVEICPPHLYTNVLRQELQYRAEKVLSEFQALVKEIPLDGKVLSEGRKNGTETGIGKGSLASTGVVWAACDALIELKTSDIGGLLVKRAEQYRDILKDALEELQEWGEETSEDEDEGDSDFAHQDVVHQNGHGNGHAMQSTQNILDNIFHEERHIPASDPHKIRERLDRTVPQLKLMTLLYVAVIKRRFKTLPPVSRLLSIPFPSILFANKPGSAFTQQEKQPPNISVIECLDLVSTTLRRIPDTVDELANSFYELDPEEIDSNARECLNLGCEVAELLFKNWEGKEDEFTTWAGKFLTAIRGSGEA